MNSRKYPQQYVHELKERWNKLEETPGIFAYRLNVLLRKRLPGEFQFYTELNAERSTLRRPPQLIESLDPVFDEHKFSFKKIKPQEKLLQIEYNSFPITVIINQSPLTRFHSLICPDIDAGHSQKITKNALEFSIHFLVNIRDEKAFRIGYNSPGALASVNHLHLHLMYLDFNLYIDFARLERLGDGLTHRLAKDMPTEAICFVIDENNIGNLALEALLDKAYAFLQWLCNENIPHNIFLTPDHQKSGVVKLFIFARERHYAVKDLSNMNIAFCELSGYVPVGDRSLFNNITEPKIIEKIKMETGTVFKKIYKYFDNSPAYF